MWESVNLQRRVLLTMESIEFRERMEILLLSKILILIGKPHVLWQRALTLMLWVSALTCLSYVGR